MRKVFNFGAGPAMLPEEVLLQAQAEMLDWHATGMSIMEMGHRGPDFSALAEQSEADMRELMEIPKNYHVLFLAGGASHQFAMVPMNLFGLKKKADYVDTGIWSKKAATEASRYGEVNIAAETVKENNLFNIPSQTEWRLTPDAAYLHYTPNETIDGIEFHWVPKLGRVPLVADMTSMILSKPVDVKAYGIIYAGTQKNLGQSGMNIVIIRDDLLQDPILNTPTLYNYKIHADNKSFYNTPPTFCWYILSLVLTWMKRQGGLKYFTEKNQRKAEKLYNLIDSYKGFYTNYVHPDCRSIMNIPFSLKSDELTQAFLDGAKEAGLTNLKGHRLVGGARASIYNAMPEKGIDTLIDYMKEFAKKNG